MFKKENLPKVYWRTSVVVAVFSYLMLPAGVIMSGASGGALDNIFIALYKISAIMAMFAIFLGVFLLFYLHKRGIETKKIRWGMYINIFAVFSFVATFFGITYD